MKSINLKTHHDNLSSFIYYIFSKPASLFFCVFLMQNVTAAVAMRSLDYPGNETDHAALLAIKSQLVDHPEGVLSSWNNSIHHCNWEGVACGRKHKRVTVLDLNSQSLSGTISPFIGNLSFLSTISLNNNSLYGQIPSNLGNLFRLQELWLGNNTLIGEIPANLSGCINLSFLVLDHNNLEGKLPVGLGALSKLERLRVDTNNFTGPLFDIIQNLTSLQIIGTRYNSFTGIIPNSIGRMQKLISLGLVVNNFYGTLPVSLFNLSSLRVLDLDVNLFSGELPAHLGFNVSGLTWLSFADNNFSGSIPAITNFTSLEYIGFDSNNFTGRIPSDFRQFHNLNRLSFADNNLEGDINFTSTLVNCTHLISLELFANNFSGTLPKSLANLSTTLIYLTIGDSLISGMIPAGITNLINLQALYMRNSKLTASLPRDIGKLHKLEALDLRSNRLTGKIPDSLGNLSRLSVLYLDNNNLEESIPRSIRDCGSLLYLNLSNNELNGTLQNVLFEGPTTFIRLDFSNNHLEGSLPLEISKQINLISLTLSKNTFSGVLPDGLSECTQLQYLYVDGNSFHGNIPSAYASLASLQEIDFSRNNLSGSIPAFFSRFPSLYYLDLAHNDFNGRVPTGSVFANASAVFLDGNSGLCGGIPEFHLPKCTEEENKERKKKTMSRALKFIILVVSVPVGGFALMIGIYLVYNRKKYLCNISDSLAQKVFYPKKNIRKKKTPLLLDSVMGKAFMKVSYNMLLEATSGFSSESLLGSGSFGSVFKGTLDGKTVAVKVLNLQDYTACKSFMAECKTLRYVRHRNLVGIITACSIIDLQKKDFRALVYEFMPNGSLDRWLYGGLNMSLLQRVCVAIDVAHALYYLHHECETPIVHCNLKPSNILLDNDMVAHVGDFGLARFLTHPENPYLSSASIGIMGSIGYAAPEYGLGSGASTAGDIYSYGILLLALITGKRPTDKMFKNDYNLHLYAEAALPDQVLQIVDPTLEEDNVIEEADDTREIQAALQRRLECIVSVISVGVSCSNHLPKNRMKIIDAIIMLQAAKDNLLNARRRRNRPTRDIS